LSHAAASPAPQTTLLSFFISNPKGQRATHYE
jgi:hypothetical protein